MKKKIITIVITAAIFISFLFVRCANKAEAQLPINDPMQKEIYDNNQYIRRHLGVSKVSVSAQLAIEMQRNRILQDSVNICKIKQLR